VNPGAGGTIGQPDPGAEPEAGALVPVSRSRWPKLVAFVVGAGLAALAVRTCIREQNVLADALARLLQEPPTRLLLIAALPLLGLVLTSEVFRLITCRFGRVERSEMLALISAGTLLNYLPLWPGLLGRLAYHRTVNKISVRSSAVAMIWANVLAAVASVSVLLLVLACSLAVGGDHLLFVVAAAAPVGLLALAAAYARARPPAPDPQVWRLILALAIRFAELNVWAARYLVCFGLMGVPVSWGGALAIAGVTGVTSLVPLTGNSLGVREWVVGLAAPLLPAALLQQHGLTTPLALGADLLNRGIELTIALPCGLIGAAIIARRLRTIQK